MPHGPCAAIRAEQWLPAFGPARSSFPSRSRCLAFAVSSIRCCDRPSRPTRRRRRQLRTRHQRAARAIHFAHIPGRRGAGSMAHFQHMNERPPQRVRPRPAIFAEREPIPRKPHDKNAVGRQLVGGAGKVRDGGQPGHGLSWPRPAVEFLGSRECIDPEWRRRRPFDDIGGNPAAAGSHPTSRTPRVGGSDRRPLVLIGNHRTGARPRHR